MPKSTNSLNLPNATVQSYFVQARQSYAARNSKNRMNLHFIEAGKPIQNAFVESFNGRFRDECLNQYWFTSIEDAATLISKWKHDYNILSPHSALGNMTPLQFRLAAEDENRPLKENKLDSTGNIKLAAVS